MYTSHFGFSLLPFENVPDPVFFFNQGQYNEIMSMLIDSVAAGRGLVVLVGPIGSGKTTISQQLAAHLAKTINLIWLAEPPDSFGELVALIAEEIGLDTKDKSRLFLLRDIQARLLEIRSQGLHCLLVIDECHRMTKNVLEGIRVLTNLEKGADKLLQIILLGQEEMVRNLNTEDMKALKQRISTLKHLDRLEPDKTRQYILHRLRLAGGKTDIFSDQALDMICLSAGGIPRVVNSFCHHSLLVAHGSGRAIVEPEHVHRAAQEVGLTRETFHYLLKLQRSTENISSPEPVDRESREPNSSEGDDDIGYDFSNLVSDPSYVESPSTPGKGSSRPALILLLFSILSLIASTGYYTWKSGFFPGF